MADARTVLRQLELFEDVSALVGFRRQSLEGSGDAHRSEERNTSTQGAGRPLERAVEDAVSLVVKRLTQKVQTDGMIKLTILREADYAAMREACGRCSKMLHSQPGEINPQLPSPENIECEFEALENGFWKSGCGRMLSMQGPDEHGGIDAEHRQRANQNRTRTGIPLSSTGR